jgi:hypothetical protein
MTKILATAYFLKLMVLLLHLLYAKNLAKYLGNSELGLYYFHISITFIYQVCFFTPFSIQYQRDYLNGSNKRDAIDYLWSSKPIIVIQSVSMILLSVVFAKPSSIQNILVFGVYSVSLFIFSLVINYLNLSNKIIQAYVLALSDLTLRNSILYLLGESTTITIIVIANTAINLALVLGLNQCLGKQHRSESTPKLSAWHNLIRSAQFSYANLGIIFSAGSNYVQNNLYKWILAYGNNFYLLGSVGSVMSIGSQIETNMINVLHNFYLNKISKDLTARRNFYAALTIITVGICTFLYYTSKTIITIALNASFVEYSGFVLIAVAYEFINYIIGNSTLFKKINLKYHLNNAIGLFASLIIYTAAWRFFGLTKGVLMAVFLLPSFISLILFLINSNENEPEACS